jgi:flagellar motor switch/type III secretory pathway protein FliN
MREIQGIEKEFPYSHRKVFEKLSTFQLQLLQERLRVCDPFDYVETQLLKKIHQTFCFRVRLSNTAHSNLPSNHSMNGSLINEKHILYLKVKNIIPKLNITFGALDKQMESILHMKENTKFDCHAVTFEELKRLDQIEVLVELQLGWIDLTARQLIDLHRGAKLPFVFTSGAEVQLLVEGEEIGKGVLNIQGDHAQIEVSELFGSEANEGNFEENNNEGEIYEC